MAITSHRRDNPIVFRERRMLTYIHIFTGQNKILVYAVHLHYGLCSQIFISKRVSKMSIELKFGRRIMSHCLTYCIDFDEFKINIFLQR